MTGETHLPAHDYEKSGICHTYTNKNLPRWLHQLDKSPNKCHYILSFYYPYEHPYCNLHNVLMVLSDGFPEMRLQVLEDGKYFCLAQYRFALAANPKKRLASVLGGWLVRYCRDKGINMRRIPLSSLCDFLSKYTAVGVTNYEDVKE
jgi:hypothetical protein